MLFCNIAINQETAFLSSIAEMKKSWYKQQQQKSALVIAVALLEWHQNACDG